ncbi:class I SAM-dependent methyltransferase [Halobium palmae]|uniref:Class I SAM-dependent methyltransferase n=1 Tax=Halobium palmae TaxID=1776492 RepID=A0ABD5S3N6_9EURY
MTSDRVHERWAERSGEFSPEYYAYYGPDERSELVRGALDRWVDPDDPVLELGCSSGRHLAHLREGGYGDLHGVDVNPESFAVMRESYPELAEAGTFHAASIESVIEEYDDDAFAAVYSVQTLQHVPPENERTFDELARVARDLLVTVEVEGDRSGDEGIGSGTERDDGTADRGDSRPGSSDPSSTSPSTAESASPGGSEVDSAGSARDVNYVTEGIPLYYRDWRAVFEGRGFEQVASEPVAADTFRAFRPASP